MDYSIIYEDSDLCVVNKLAPLPVQADKTGDASIQDLLKCGNKFYEAVNRLDRPCTGLVVFAKNKKSLARLMEIFRERQVTKEYLACCAGRPALPEALIEHRLDWNKRRNIVRALPWENSTDKTDPSYAALEYNLLAQFEQYSLLKIKLHTGRHHQIRAQLAALGLAIVGDVKYGAVRIGEERTIMLHASRLCLEHPRSAAALDLIAPLPSHPALWASFEAALHKY